MSEATKVEQKKAAPLVKVRAIRPFTALGRVINRGETVEIDPETAARVCRDSKGPFDFFGERQEADERDHRRANLKRAELVA